MNTFRIALACVPDADNPDDAVRRVEDAIRDAAAERAGLVCFPECYVPGYRGLGKRVPPPDAAFLERAWRTVAAAAAREGVAVVLGTERVTPQGTMISAIVIDRDGTVRGFQDKVQLDPSEHTPYIAGIGRHLFRTGPLTFGVAICHEGFRYPETVRWAAQRGAQVVFHPYFDVAMPGSIRPATFLDPANTFHEKAILCRAAENTCFVASVNCASDGAPATSAIARPDGSVLAWQPYGQAGLLVADLDLDEATGLLAKRLRTEAYSTF